MFLSIYLFNFSQNQGSRMIYSYNKNRSCQFCFNNLKGLFLTHCTFFISDQYINNMYDEKHRMNEE